MFFFPLLNLLRAKIRFVRRFNVISILMLSLCYSCPEHFTSQEFNAKPQIIHQDQISSLVPFFVLESVFITTLKIYGNSCVIFIFLYVIFRALLSGFI